MKPTKRSILAISVFSMALTSLSSWAVGPTEQAILDREKRNEQELSLIERRLKEEADVKDLIQTIVQECNQLGRLYEQSAKFVASSKVDLDEARLLDAQINSSILSIKQELDIRNLRVFDAFISVLNYSSKQNRLLGAALLNNDKNVEALRRTEATAKNILDCFGRIPDKN